MAKIFWWGMGGHHWGAEQFREEIIEAGHQLLTCHEYPNADLKYDRLRIFEYLDQADVVILPTRWKLEPAKSVNRLGQAWSRGKACVVSPLPAYLKYVVPGVNALVGTNRDEFLAQILRLAGDPELRAKLGMAGKDTANDFLHPRKLFAHFNDRLTEALGSSRAQVVEIAPAHPEFENVVLQVVVPHYGPNLHFLEECLSSLSEAARPKDTRVTVVSSGSDSQKLAHVTKKFGASLIHPGLEDLKKDRLTFSEANNLAIRRAGPEVTHFLFLNDDTIVSRQAIRGYFQALGGRDNIVINPFSNCDQGWLHQERLIMNGVALYPGMPYEEGIKATSGILDAPLGPTDLITAPFCAWYATLVPNKVLRAVGPLSEEFLNGGEDADWCYRSQSLGFKTYWTKAAFVFHFGGKSRKVSQDHDPEKHVVEDQFNNLLLHRKWPQRSATKKAAIWTGPAWETWGLESYLTGGIGGSETCAGRLAQTFADNGWQVTMIGEHEEGWQYNDRIQMLDWKTWDPESQYFHFFVASRNINPVDWRLKAGKIVAYCHDLWLLSGQKISDYHYQRVDRFLTLSPWHRDFFLQHHQVPQRYLDKVIVVPNGVNIELSC